MNILAIDPAARCGFAHSNGQHGVWELGTGERQLETLDWKISQAIADWGCDVIAYEAATFGSRHAHVMRRHNEKAGVIQLVALRENVPCWCYPPTQWKAMALGKGNLDKQGVIRMVKLIYGIKVNDPDVADSIGILMAAQRGPPPESKRKQQRAAEKRLVKRAKLF